MKEITKYVADDGEEFYDADECMEYENNLKMLCAVSTITNICDRRESCSGCALHNACSSGNDNRWFYHTPDMWHRLDLEQPIYYTDKSLEKAIAESNENVKNMPDYDMSRITFAG